MLKIILPFILVIVVLLVVCIVIKHNNLKEDELYDNYLKKIKKSFANILVNVSTIPKPNGKTIIKISHIDDLVDISLKIKKPIYYIEKDNRTCDFILIDESVYNIYSLKINDELLSAFDIYNKNKNENEIYSKALDNLITTTIIRLPNGNLFKVSPLKRRKKKDINIEE